MIKLYAMSEEITTIAAKKKLENIIKNKSESLTFELEKGWNKEPSFREQHGHCNQLIHKPTL